MTTKYKFIIESERDQAIELDSKDIKVLDFVFDEFPGEVIRKAKKRTLDYFS